MESFAQGLCTMVEVLHEDSILYCPSSSPEITSYLFPPINSHQLERNGEAETQCTKKE